jgi:hypothetical protein
VRADVHSRTHRVAHRLCGRGLWICEGASCTKCRTGLRPKEWPMCARCYATTHRAVATHATMSLGLSVWRPPRGARIIAGSMDWTNPHAVALFRTSRGVPDLSMLFCRPTAAHLAPFILPSLGRRSALRRPCAALRQTAIRQKLRSSMSGAGCVQLDCSFYADSLMDERASRIAASTEGRTQELRLSCPLFGRSYAGRRPADGSRSNVVMSGVVDSGRES